MLATSINKYCYLMVRRLPPFFSHKHRIVYSKIELPNEVDKIEHPSVRECLKYMKITDGIEIHHAGDLPAMTGMGTSSSFTVGLLHALHALKGNMPNKLQLATQAIHVEQNMIGENVGNQDQITAAFGGFNMIEFGARDTFTITPVTLKCLEELNNHLMLFFTGFSHTASEIAGKLIAKMEYRKGELQEIRKLVDDGMSVLKRGNLRAFGYLLHEAWELKRSLCDGISTDAIDALYSKAINLGAIGGKLLGAGGGGFLLLFVPLDRQERVRKELGLLEVPFRFENEGSRIVYYNND